MVDTEHIQMAHGGGGQLTEELIAQVILPAVGGQDARKLADAATFSVGNGKLAFTTDSYVVRPLVFPGGDIGKLAICGTVNDLSVVGAVPKAMSLALVIQEGLEIALLKQVLASAGAAARAAGVSIVTGDTKVVDRSASDGLVINTAGIGEVMPEAKLGFDHVTGGDRILLSGPLGEHGLAIMSTREHLSFTADLESDCALLCELTQSLVRKLGDAIKFMRDPTRGGLAATLADLAAAVGRDIEIHEDAIPVNRTAKAAAEMLGLDLLAAANEGKLVAVVAADAAEDARKILAAHKIAAKAAIIGTVGEWAEGPIVEMVTRVGGRRVIQMPYGEELPRIC